MKRISLLAALAAIALATSATADNSPRTPGATAPGVGLGQRPTLVSTTFGCVVAGSPVEFPNDINLKRTFGPTVAGTQVKWNVPGTPYHGVVTLPALAPGQSFHVSNVLPGLTAGTLCNASLN